MYYTPRRRHELQIERDKELIRPALRDIFNKLLLGKKSFPLYMYGTAGGGKTCAALCFLDFVTGQTVYWNMNRLHQDVAKARQGELWTEAYPQRIITENEIFKRIEDANMVVLDEIGSRQTVSDTHYDCLKKTIDLRHGKPLIVIGNPGLNEIEDIYDARVRSRLQAGTLVELTADRRQEPKLKIPVNPNDEVPF